MVLTEPAELGHVIVLSGGSLTVRDLPEPGLQLTGHIRVVGDGWVRLENSVIQFMSLYHGQYSQVGAVAQFSLDPEVAARGWLLEASSRDGGLPTLIGGGDEYVEDDVLEFWSDADPALDYLSRAPSPTAWGALSSATSSFPEAILEGGSHGSETSTRENESTAKLFACAAVDSWK